MSLYRRAAKRDAVEAAIVEALRKSGWSVLQISVPDGPDLFAAKSQQYFWKDANGSYHYEVRPRCVAIECKTGKKTLRPGQEAFKAAWQGEYVVLRSVQDALSL